MNAAGKLETACRATTVANRMEQATMAESAAVTPGTIEVPAAVVLRVRGLLSTASEAQVARRLGLSRHFLVRVAAGQRIRAGSLMRLLAALDGAGQTEGR
jgi:hypothetical protein